MNPLMYIFQRVRQAKINAYIQIILQPYQRSMKLNSFKTLLNMTTIAKNQNQIKRKNTYFYLNHYYCSLHLCLNRILEKKFPSTIVNKHLIQ